MAVTFDVLDFFRLKVLVERLPLICLYSKRNKFIHCVKRLAYVTKIAYFIVHSIYKIHVDF